MTDTAIANALDRIERRLDRIAEVVESRKALLTQAAAARHMGVSPQTFARRYVVSGQIALHRGKVRRTDLESLL